MNRLYLKQNFHTLKMKKYMSLKAQLNEFNKITMYLKNIDIKIDDEDQNIIVLYFLPSIIEHFITTLLYENDIISMEVVKTSLTLKSCKRRCLEKRVRVRLKICL